MTSPDPTQDPATAELERLRAIEQAATPGPWWSDENGDTWRLHGVAGRIPAWSTCGIHKQPDPDCTQCAQPLIPAQVVNKQILKAPKHGTPYAEYWPDPADAEFIVTARTAFPRLVAAIEAVLKRHVQIEKLTRLGPPAFRVCADCDQIWPCNTFEAITRSLTGTQLEASPGG